MASPQQIAPLAIGLAVVILAWRIGVRVRRTIGRQPLRLRRLRVSAYFLPFALLMLFLGACRHPLSAVAQLAGIALGVGAATYSFRTSSWKLTRGSTSIHPTHSWARPSWRCSWAGCSIAPPPSTPPRARSPWRQSPSSRALSRSLQRDSCLASTLGRPGCCCAGTSAHPHPPRPRAAPNPSLNPGLATAGVVSRPGASRTIVAVPAYAARRRSRGWLEL